MTRLSIFVHATPGLRTREAQGYVGATKRAYLPMASRPEPRWKVRLTAAGELVVFVFCVFSILFAVSLVGVQ